MKQPRKKKHPPKGKCTDCLFWIKDDPDPKKCSCRKLIGYVTMNALRRLACRFFKQVSVKDCFDKTGKIIHWRFDRWREYMRDRSEECLEGSVEMEKRVAEIGKQVKDLGERVDEVLKDIK